MAPKVFSLEELGQEVGIHPRAIRSYIQQGLLRGPESMGRNAHYTEYHLKRLKVIKTLKDEYGMSLSEIRSLVTMAGPDEDIKIVSLLPELAKGVETQSSALDFIKLRQDLSKDKPAEPISSLVFREPQSSYRTMPGSIRGRVSPRLEQLLEKLKTLSSGSPKRRTRGEDWIRLKITPDIEFHIRGQLSQEQLACFEQLADTMRHILLGENGDG